jgi:peroxiredoxin
MKLPIIAALLVAAALPCSAQSPQTLLGKPAPSFTVESGDGRRLSLDMVKGRVTVIFYETKEASRRNSDVKDRLNDLYDRQDERTRQSIVRVPVFNCSLVFWPVSLVWKESLKKHSKRVGITLYGDWDGRMGRDFQMKDSESNVVLIDRRGTIRYASYGRITDRQFAEIEELLDRLVNREN